jgi:hemoglobin
MHDIQTSGDVHTLVSVFYNKIMDDKLLSPFFTKLDWDEHLPKMEKFWRFVLLEETGYTTNVTEKHLQMHLSAIHFKQWIALFNEAVDELYAGENAEKAKQRATLIGWTIQSKMN